MKAIHSFRACLQRQGRPRLWGLAAAAVTTVLAVLAALVWLDRPAPAPREGASLPRVSQGGDLRPWTPGPRLG